MRGRLTDLRLSSWSIVGVVPATTADAQRKSVAKRIDLRTMPRILLLRRPASVRVRRSRDDDHQIVRRTGMCEKRRALAGADVCFAQAGRVKHQMRRNV